MSAHNPELPPVRAKGMVHKQIAKTAKGLANEHYEELAKNNAFYARWPNRKEFVRKNWEHYIAMTRQMLTAMLGDPKLDENTKRQIYAAVMLDGAINPKQLAKPEKPTYFALEKPKR